MTARRVPLYQGAYTARSFIAAAQRSLNLYAEKDPAGEDSPSTHYPTPGLTRLGVPPEAAPVRGLYRATNGQLFAAIGSGVYYIAPDWTSTLIGTTAVNTTPVRMGDNGVTAVIVDGSAFGWQWDLPTHVYGAISDPNFFGSNFVESLDTYLLFNSPGTNVFYSSDSNSLTFDPLFFAAKVGYPDLLGGIAVQTRDIWLIGNQSSSEIWTDVGAADFPFQILPGPFPEIGTIATYSIAKNAGSVFWLSQDAAGTSVVVQAFGFAVKPISTPAVEAAIASYPYVADAIGFTYEQQGHTFYWLKFPSANENLGVDWVYDTSTQLWHERSWMNPATCAQEGHRALCHAFCYGVNVVGDRLNGQLYMLDLDNPTDAGDFVERRRGYPHMMADGNRAYYPQFIADLAAGTQGTTSPAQGLPAGLASTETFPASIEVIKTTFTAPDTTLLQNYWIPYGIAAKDIGSQYTSVDLTINLEIINGGATGSGTGSTNYLASGKPTSPDMVIQFNAIPSTYPGVPANGKSMWAIGRADSINNGYRVFLVSDGSQFNLALDVMNGGSFTQIPAGTIAGGIFTVFLSTMGTTIMAALQRSEDGFWLAPDSTWQAVFTAGITITDSNYATAGNVLIGGQW